MNNYVSADKALKQTVMAAINRELRRSGVRELLNEIETREATRLSASYRPASVAALIIRFRV